MSQTTRNANKNTAASSGDMSWWHLSLVGIGCTVGTGYFLGSSIGIRVTGPSIVFSFILAALGTYIVFSSLAKMTAADPQEGSFCYYADKAFGRWAGFSSGWNYWCSSVLIMGSQLTALAILTQLWFPSIPLWLFSAIYAVLSILIVLLGTKSFDKMEDLFAVIKTAAIIMFIILAIAALAGWIPSKTEEAFQLSLAMSALFPGGFGGFWASFIYAFYAYGGIEVIGLMAMQLKNKEEAPKAGKVMLFSLATVYVLSLTLAVMMVPIHSFTTDESPFVTALADYSLPFFKHAFNGAIIIAGFSTMTAALYGVTALLVIIAKDENAPSVFRRTIQWKDVPLPSLGLGAVGLLASVLTALLLPETIYEYITTAAGILLLYNWLFIIASSSRNLKEEGVLQKTGSISGIVIVLVAVSGTVMEGSIRPGFYISFIFVCVIAVVTLYMNRKWKKEAYSES
ncbi:amino acid permease [Alteribacillus iranensis]|uniref:L-asparagine transporter n=1 Tax=Alteribacillus iranensis TaxID=930128 RepID=A0A1I2FFS8_9BACI|nr:amino acid permease [Alteribacillus iranensis]SFF04364.1 L-asparagine transporter [Alteribacillus iranensis]